MKIPPLESFAGVYNIPPDKSITHRAIMFNALSKGKAKIENALLGEDCLATIDCMRKLGAEIAVEGSTVNVTGIKRLKNKQKLFVGNSGTTIRLLLGALAGSGKTVYLDGDDSIRKRPMSRVIEPLSQMGAKIVSEEGGLAPITVKPADLKGVEYTLPVASAQVKSALILAGLNAEGDTKLTCNVKTRNHSELMLSAMSADVRTRGKVITVKKSELKSLNITVPGDISSAMYFIVLAAVLKESTVLLKKVGINPTRKAALDLMVSIGAKISLINQRNSGGEPVADILVESSPNMQPFTIEGAMVANLIDEIPVLCVLAALLEGTSVIKDAQELKVKESDRIKVTVDSLKKMGVNAEATDDGMIIKGSGVIMGGVEIDSEGDHRIAMSMAVAGAASLDGVTILNHEAVNVSFPGFFDSLLNSQQQP